MNVTVTYQPMIPDDYDDVLALWEGCEGIWLHPRAGDGREDIARYLERNQGLSLAARVEGALAGAVLCGHDGRRGSLNHLAVAPAFRGQGIGRALVERCLAALGEQGIARCNILVVAGNEAGRQFWRHLTIPPQIEQPYTRAGMLASIAECANAFDNLAAEWSPAYRPEPLPLLAMIARAGEAKNKGEQ